MIDEIRYWTSFHRETHSAPSIDPLQAKNDDGAWEDIDIIVAPVQESVVLEKELHEKIKKIFGARTKLHKILCLHEEGYTLKEIGVMYNCTESRICQLFIRIREIMQPWKHLLEKEALRTAAYTLTHLSMKAQADAKSKWAVSVYAGKQAKRKA